MMNGIKSMQEAVERIRDAQNVQIFQNELLLLKEYMKNIGMEKEDLLKLERTAYYIKNEYSDKDTKENMEAAKERVVRYIEDIIYDNTDDESLLKILGNFYLNVLSITNTFNSFLHTFDSIHHTYLSEPPHRK